MRPAFFAPSACCLILALSLMLWSDYSLADDGTTYKEPKTGMEFVKIPAGSFMMGCDTGAKFCEDNEKPRHKVTLQGFFMARTEVTQAQWVAVMGSNPSVYKGDDRPVDSVTWVQADSFCKKIGARLPTEAEWEYAARAGGSSEFICGDNAECLGSNAWCYKNYNARTHPVGQKLANNWGLYDMTGNVWEWVADWYAKNYYSVSSPTNPAGPASGSSKVMRGGSFAYSGSHGFRLALRVAGDPSFVDNMKPGQGFRCAKSD